MKKILFPAFMVVAISFTTVSCKKNTTTTADRKEVVAVDNDKDANAIIEFNNSLLEKRERRASTLTRISSYLEGVEDFIAGNRPVLIPPIGMIDISKAVDAPDALGKNKDEVTKLVEESKVKYDAIKAKTDELVAYIKAEDFKDDNSAKAKTLKAEIIKLGDEYTAIENKINTIMSPIADGAEEIILKDHPLKDYIIGSKDVLNKALKLEETLNNQITSNKFDMAAFRKQYAELETAVKTNTAREFKVEDASLTSKKGYYESFNKAGEEYLGEVRKIMRAAETAGKFTPEHSEDIYNAYEGLLRSYNNFVD